MIFPWPSGPAAHLECDACCILVLQRHEQVVLHCGQLGVVEVLLVQPRQGVLKVALAQQAVKVVGT